MICSSLSYLSLSQIFCMDNWISKEVTWMRASKAKSACFKSVNGNGDSLGNASCCRLEVLRSLRLDSP